jgi:ABC-type branched-subunit amino acid transport system substrate-binding protein
MGDAMLGTISAHFYSAAHASALNAAFTDASRKEAKDGANFMAVSGYDGMHVIYEALKKTGGARPPALTSKPSIPGRRTCLGKHPYLCLASRK